MRARIVLVSLLLILTPVFFLHAAEEETSKEKEDPKPAHEGTTDICLSEKVSVEDEELVVEELATSTPEYKPRYDQCRQANDNKGCTAKLEKEGKCKCGTVTYTVTPDGKPCDVSKCDPEGEKTASQCIAKGGVSLTSLQERQILRDYIVDTGKLPDWVEEAFTDQQLKTVQERLVTDKASVADQIASLYYPRDAKEQQEAAQELGITPEQLQKLATNSVRLTPDQQRQITGETSTDHLAGGSGGPGGLGAQTTGWGAPIQTQGIPMQCGVPGLAGNIMRVESNCGRINSNPLSSVQGPYHFLCATWQSYTRVTGYGQYADCRYRNDPQISTQVMNARLAQYEQSYGGACRSSGLTISSCLYAIHVFGEGGFQGLLQAHRSGSGASVCGWVLSSSACRNNSSIFRGGANATNVFAELDRRLGNQSVISNVATGSFSPLGNFTQGGGFRSTSAMGASPFGNVSPFGANSYQSGFNTVAPVGAPGGGVAPGGGQQGGTTQFQQTQGGSGTRTNNGTNNDTKNTSKDTTKSGTSTKSILDRARSALDSLLDAVNPDENESTETKNPVDPVSTIFAQPQTITRGDSLLVSWSSLGMSTDIPCRVLVTSGTVTSLLAEGNDGSETIGTDGSQPQGEWKFILRCTAQKNGALVDQEAVVTVE
ncbi:hypothetical protein C4585_00145 [Candidatus Parcubacteria bacterium]|nr:MAG: hypothetical protein C4585_00145 [Candidatus Parcubacteria bacterium]